MDTMAAFMIAEANRGNEQKVFDWDLAAKLINEAKDNNEGNKIFRVQAGLKEDFDWTGGTIYENDAPVFDDTHMYLASIWATPIIVIWFKDNYEPKEYSCYVMKSQTEWDAHTLWPKSALDILNSHEIQPV